MSTIWKLPVAALAALTLAACNSTGAKTNPGGPLPGQPDEKPPVEAGGELPVKTAGKMLAVRLPGTITAEVSDWDDLPMQSVTIEGTVATDRTAPEGVGISGSADEDKKPNKNQGGGPAVAALISAKADGKMEGGTSIIGLDKTKGSVYFENGNFGDPQVSSDNAAISSVGVYNIFHDDGSTTQVLLKDVTTVRYRDGNAGDTEANFGVGYVGNSTASMPGSGTATYAGFYEQGVGVYEAADGSVATMFMKGETKLTADFGAGKVTGGVKNGSLEGIVGGKVVNLNSDVKGLDIKATIAGSEYAGTAALVNGAGGKVGTVSHGNAIGGFFGADAAETAAAVSIEGKAKLDGTASNYVLQGVLGATRK